ncbi:MAG: putative sensor domain DACNV-containing protein [Desulfobulbaceae bacterium]
MVSAAFILNQHFIDDLWNRINALDSAFTPFEVFDTSPPRGVVPSKEHLASLIDAVFWTSYEKEEGTAVSVSLIFRKPEQGADTFCFDKPIPLSPKSLVKLGPALENPRAHISVWPDEQGFLKVWGFRTGSDEFITYDLWVQGLGPGCVLITFGGKSLAALIESKAVFVDTGILMKAILPKITHGEARGRADLESVIRYNSLLFIAQAMRSHGHGGTVLVVPEGSDWQQSIRHPVPYTGGASFLDTSLENLQAPSGQLKSQKGFFDFIKKAFAKRHDKSALQREKIKQQCSRIARLTAVDGALVMTPDRYTYCFGAKIEAIEPTPSAFELQALKPIEGYPKTSLNFSDLGGTRHLSAAQFAHDQPEAIALVASQDGDVTFFTQEAETGDLMAIQQAELALLHEGLSGALWNISLMSRMEELKNE